MYQMVSYAIRRKCSTIHLIYPELFEEYYSNKPNKNVKFVVQDEFTDYPKRVDINIFVHKVPWYLHKESYTEKGIMSLESFRETDKIIKNSLKSILNV
jgi:hypothetical protein